MLSLKKNFSYALIGNLVYAFCQYIILLIYIKLYPVEEVGVFIYATAFSTPLMLALEMQLRNFYITDQKEAMSFNTYYLFRLITNIIGVLILGFATFLLKPEFSPVIIVVIFIKVVESQLDLLYGVYQKEHRLDYVAYSRIYRGLLAVLVVGVTSFIFRNILISLLSYLGTWLSLYFFYERKHLLNTGFVKKNDFKFLKPNFKQFKKLLFLCVPMFFTIFLDKYYLNYPRIIVEEKFGVEILGIFGALLYFKSLGGQFISSLAQTTTPKLSNYISENKVKPFQKLFYKMVLLGFLIGISLTMFCYFWGEFLLEILYTKEYVSYSNVLIVILLGATVTFTYMFIASALTCMRKQWIKLPIAICSFSAFFLLMKYGNINSLMDVSLSVLYIEILTLFIYLFIYFFFIRKTFFNYKTGN